MVLPSAETPDASPTVFPVLSRINVSTPSTHFAPFLPPESSSCHPTITEPSLLTALALELLPATILPKSTTPPADVHLTACAVPAEIQPNPTIVFPSPDIPHVELALFPDAAPRLPRFVQVVVDTLYKAISVLPEVVLVITAEILVPSFDMVLFPEKEPPERAPICAIPLAWLHV